MGRPKKELVEIKQVEKDRELAEQKPKQEKPKQKPKQEKPKEKPKEQDVNNTDIKKELKEKTKELDKIKKLVVKINELID